MKRPCVPHRPTEPIKPNKTKTKTTYLFDFSKEKTISTSFEDLFLKKGILLEDIDFSNLWVETSMIYDFNISIFYDEIIPNPIFDIENAEYEKNMIKYEYLMKEYFPKLKMYNEKKSIYDAQKLSENLENKKKEKKRLERKLEKLNKELNG